ncbi:hypothetical protein Geu3261_0069_010 [Komagataeibacter europaeus NBRC 3261]|uniref:Uncharacterized protein n=1 Tax=Komagataeibacter europaeus NBRC 3261 TaxID=1234669 RepID=A0A0D6PZG6_KOMEU|nr:hypothetical protein Geu3261_0069_010 [Komagataeibacter europaeus NBRC 3261]
MTRSAYGLKAPNDVSVFQPNYLQLFICKTVLVNSNRSSRLFLKLPCASVMIGMPMGNQNILNIPSCRIKY